jgi:uncharacterized protein (TIRG00374 family)
MDNRNGYRWIPVIAVGAAMVTVLSRADMKMILGAIGRARWTWITIVLVLTVLNTLIEAIRWKPLLNSVKKSIPTQVAFSAVLMGITGNTFLPFRLGDTARIYYIAVQEELTLADSFSTVALDHITDIAFFIVITACSFPFFHFLPPVGTAILYAGGAIILGSAVFLYAVRKTVRAHSSLIGRGLSRVGEQFQRFAFNFSALLHLRNLLTVVFWFTVSWFARLAMVFAGLKAFFPDLPPTAALAVLIFLNLGIAAVATPANLGGFELSMIAALKLFSLDTGSCMSCAVVFHFATILPNLVLALVVVRFTGFNPLRSKRHIPTLSGSVKPGSRSGHGEDREDRFVL